MVTERTKKVPMEKLEETIKVLDEAGVQLLLKKCKLRRKHGMVGIQTISRRNEANRRKSTSDNRQTSAKESKRFEIIHGSN